MKTTIKFIALGIVCSSLAIAVFADTIVEPTNVDSVVTIVKDSTSVVPTNEATASSVFTISNIIIILTGLYEIAIRVYPTAKNYSLLSIAYKILNFLVPNKKKEGGTHS